jgi:hypothetical protein
MPPAPEVPTSANEKHLSRKAYSFSTWSKIFPGHMNVPLWAMLCVPGIVCVIFYLIDGDEWALYVGPGLIAVFLLRWLIEYLRKLATHATYKNFPRTLGFELKGWEKVGAYTNQLKYRHWSDNTTIQIFVFEHAGQSELKAIKALLDAFIVKSKKHFYHRDSETNWAYNGSLIIKGSSDANVIGDIYTLINEQLKNLNEKKKIIRAVSVQFDPQVRYEEPPASTDTMS